MTISRRRLLAGAAVLALLPPRHGFAAIDQSEALLALLPDRAAAAKLGQRWVDREQPRPDAILANLQQRLNGADAAKLRDAVAEDFRWGAVVKIEGWQIARTQAELCALAYFSAVGSL
jgi:hypothetical protein